MAIAPTKLVETVQAATAPRLPESSSVATVPFTKLVNNLLSDANAQQLQADQALHQLIEGKSENVHDVVLATAKADLSFRMVLEIRNRLIESYQEIMRMQV